MTKTNLLNKTPTSRDKNRNLFGRENDLEGGLEIFSVNTKLDVRVCEKNWGNFRSNLI